jgi:flagellar biosynthesis protein FlhG
LSAIAVCSGKGSPGATFVAANLAAALSRANEETVLLDLDPAGGDLCCYLGLDPRRGLYPLLRMEGTISGTARLLTEAEERSGFRAVGGFPESSELASTGVLAGALAAASASGRIVVADLGRVFETNAPIVAKCDLVLLVVRADLVSVLGAERALRQLEAEGTRRERVTVVVSGHEKRRPADLAEVGEALRLPVLGAVPLDQRGARKALLSQSPAATRRLRRAFDALAAATRRTIAEVSAEPEMPVPEFVEVRA